MIENIAVAELAQINPVNIVFGAALWTHHAQTIRVCHVLVILDVGLAQSEALVQQVLPLELVIHPPSVGAFPGC